MTDILKVSISSKGGMKMKKTTNGRRALSILFAFVMIFGIMTLGTLAVAAEETAIVNDTNAAAIGTVEYATLDDAIKAVADGETITLLKDCAQNVTIKQTAGKSFTIDGNGKNYTGTVTIDGANNSNGKETLTFANIIFRANNSIIGTKTSPHNVTFSDCEFYTSGGYSLTVQHSYNWSFIGCRAYGTGAFMQISASPTHNLYVEDFVAEVSGNVFKIDYCTTTGTTATFKDVTVKSGVVGFYISNRNSGAINFENVNATCQYPIYIWDRSTGIATPLVFTGENIFTSTAGNEWLTAKDGTANVDGIENVTFGDTVAKVGTTVYTTLKEAVEAAGQIDGGAVVQLLSDVTVDEKITVSGNVTISGAYTVYRAEAYTGTLFSVNSGATLTLDGGLTVDGGNNYTFDKDAYMRDAIDNWNVSITKEESAKWFTPEDGAPVATAYMITTDGGTVNLNSVTVKNNYSVSYGVVSAGEGSAVTLTGARITHVAATQSGGVIVNVSGANINVTVNEGTVIDGNHVGSNHGLFKIYSGAVMTMNGGEITNNTGWNSNGVAVGVYRGSFYLNGGLICSNVGVYGPANGRNAAIYLHSGHTFEMTGGTVCHNSGRARGGIDAPYDNGITLIKGGAVLDNISYSGGSEYDVFGTAAMQISGGTFTQDVTKYLAPGIGLVYDETLGMYVTTEDVYEFMGEKYSSLDEIIAIIKAGEPDTAPTVKVLANHRIHTPIVVDVSLVLDLDGKNITGNCYPVLRIQGGATVTLTGDGYIRNSDYVFVLGASDGTSAGNLIIENGSYRGVITVASVTKGKLTVNGGSFSIDTDDTYNSQYLLNCIDASYRDGSAVIEVRGGTFKGFNPKDNAAEGVGTDFLAVGYGVTEETEGYYTVAPVLTFRSSNLLLGNTIGIYFNLNTADLADGVNYVAVFTIHGTEYTVPRYDENGDMLWKVKSENPEVTGILFEGIAAKEMSIPISVVIMLDGKVVSNTATDSVKSYVERGIERGIFTAEDMDLVIQMINYGALAQQSFVYNTSDLANGGEYAAGVIEEYTRDDGEYTNKLDATNYYGASLNLENNVGFNFKFFADVLAGADKAVITYVNHTGKEFVIEIAAADFGSDEKHSEQLVVIHLDTLVAADARQMLTCKIFDADGNVLAYATDSIESYCARAIAGLEIMNIDEYSDNSFKIEFYQALMKYSMAAYDYDPLTKR